MRLRANIEDVLTFQRIIQSIERLQKRCIVRFTETEMHIICNTESEDGVQVWSQIKVDALFTDYRIQSNAANEISLAVPPDALLQALRSASASSSSAAASSSAPAGAGADAVVMKLAKKAGRAVLSIEIACAAGGGRGLGVRVAHDVLIEVLRPADVARLREPLCPEPDIHILLPPLQKLRTVVEHLRPLADVLAVHASGAGALRLAVATDGVSVDTQWAGCVVPSMASQGDEAREEPPKDPAQMFGVLLSMRSFLKFLSCHVVSTTTIACICQNHCIILYVYIGDASAPTTGGVLTFYIPARLSGVD